MGRVFDLPPLALLAGEALVIRDLLDHRPDLGAEPRLQLCRRGFSVLDGVMEDGGEERHAVRHAPDAGQELRRGDRVVDVGGCRGILATLETVLVRGEVQGLQQQRDVVDWCLQVRV
jgi:hypothetical protein